MTKKELLEELEGLPDDAAICFIVPMTDEYAEATGIEYFGNEHYYDAEDEPKKGKIIVI